MPIPSNNSGMGGVITPLSPKYNQNYLPQPANGEVPVKQKWFNGGDVNTIVIRPELNRSGIPDPVAPKPKEIDIKKFFPGGAS